MCGIHGIVSRRPGYRPDLKSLHRMGDLTIHRGPDDSGSFCSEQVALGMRRLSIIDVAGGHQPLSGGDGAVQVVCNGEIYNFRELRADLEKLGYRFSTGSDSEVIVHLYMEYGIDFVDRLDGMFGFAIWDARHDRLVLGRDRIGIKPLYFYVDSNRLVFASEAKSILAVGDITAEMDHEGLDELLYLGYVGGSRTIFRGIRKLLPAQILICEKGEISEHTYWRYRVEDSARIASIAECQDLLREELEQSVVAQMVSDVPLGAFLSGGIDSSAVVALMAANSSRPVKTYSIGFDTGAAGSYYNELPYARQVSELFGTDHREIVVRPDVARLLPKLIWHMDEPVADSALMTTFLVAEFARQDVTVILSGAGGDELFGGYRRYLGAYYTRMFSRLPGWLRRKLLIPGARLLPSDRHGPVSNLLRYARQFILSSDLPPLQQYASYLQLFDEAQRREIVSLPSGLQRSSLDDAFARLDTGDWVNGLMQIDMETQLPDDILMLTDRMTMAASIECRVPLLGNRLLDLAARIPSSHKIQGRRLKHVLKETLAGVLPDNILNRQKRGFGAPMGAWLKKELQPLVQVMLGREAIERRGLFEPDVVARTIALHQAGKEDYSDHLQCLLNLEIWCRIYLDGQSADDIGTELAERVAPVAMQ